MWRAYFTIGFLRSLWIMGYGKGLRSRRGDGADGPAGAENGAALLTRRFRSDIAAVTRDAEGHVIAGSLNDAIEAVDVWTFSRQLNSSGPDWLLDETDAG